MNVVQTKTQLKNEEYLDEIWEGKIICEGVNLKEITKNMILE